MKKKIKPASSFASKKPASDSNRKAALHYFLREETRAIDRYRVAVYLLATCSYRRGTLLKIRDIADELGIEATNVSRALKALGYMKLWTMTRSKQGATFKLLPIVTDKTK